MSAVSAESALTLNCHCLVCDTRACYGKRHRNLNKFQCRFRVPFVCASYSVIRGCSERARNFQHTHTHMAVNYSEREAMESQTTTLVACVKFGLCSTFYSLRWINWYFFLLSVIRIWLSVSRVPLAVLLTLKCMRVVILHSSRRTHRIDFCCDVSWMFIDYFYFLWDIGSFSVINQCRYRFKCISIGNCSILRIKNCFFQSKRFQVFEYSFFFVARTRSLEINP